MIKNKEFELIIKEMELNTYNFTDISNFRKQLENLQENLDNEKIYEINDELTFEILFLYYEIRERDLVPVYSIDDISFPDYTLFNDDCINYLNHRFEVTKNCLLKSLYSLILWDYYNDIGEKKICYLHSFVDSSLNIIPMIHSKKDCNPTDYWMMKRALESAFIMGVFYGYKKDEIKNSILDFIYDDSIEINHAKKELIELMLSQKKVFKKNDFEGMDTFCWNLYLKENNMLNKIDFLLVGQRVDNKIECRNYNWYEEIGKCYEQLMDETEYYIEKVDYCNEAIRYYKKSGNKEKEFSLLKKLEMFNRNIGRGIIKIPLDLKGLDIFITSVLSEKILYTPKEMIDYLIYSNSELLINKFKKNRDIYDNLLKTSPILMEASKKLFDSNRNIRKNVSSNISEKEKINFINERVYVMSLEIINKTYLDRLFVFIYENKICSDDDIINSLPIFFNYPIGDERNIVPFLKPLIKDYFYQIETFLNSPTGEPTFIMFIDSICSKIEYLLKAICSKNGITVTTMQQDGLTSMVTLNIIFNNEEFKKLIIESDYNLLKYVLLEPGLNLRNKSAHGLDLSIYNFSNANLLFLCFFRILKYFL